MTRNELFTAIQQKQSYLCVGLDTDIKKIPPHLLSSNDPVFEFNKQIIDATHDVAVSYKLNIAFYESLGIKGWEALVKTINYIPENIFTIADAKRGDIGNTSSMYARAFFDKASSGMSFDAITVAPYMGEDSVKPFFDFKEKWVILLALTSNSGSNDFQLMKDEKEMLYEKVLRTSQNWAGSDKMMYVVGATHPETFKHIRSIVPDHFLLVPGAGAQGGSLEAVSENGMNKQCGLLINSSRNIIYASNGADFATAAKKEAMNMQQAMREQLLKFRLV